MAFRSLAALAEIIADDIQQVIDALTGVVGRGQAISLTQLNDSTAYALQVRQNDTSTGQIAKFMKSGNQAVLDLLQSGALISPDGLTTAAPVTTSHIQTLTNKTLGYFKWTRGSSTASTASLTLPTDGNLVPISGTVTITSITAATAGTLVCLEFASPACKVTRSATLRLSGDFNSAAAGATLLLECDGVNWNEVGRGSASAYSARCPASGQTLVDNAAIAVMALNTATYDPFTLKSGNTLVAKVAGIYRVSGNVVHEANSGGRHYVEVYKNGGSYQPVAGVGGGSSNVDYCFPFSFEDRFAANDALDVRTLIGAVGTNLALRTSSNLSLSFVSL